MTTDAPGLYVHVPFCATKCRYCAFASGTCLDRAPAWSDAVQREARRRTRRPDFAPFDTLYLGGGTPGLLEPGLLSGLLERLRQTLAFATDVEATIEANPGDVSPERAAAWRAMGLNRASLGVQSLDDADLRFLGRRHDAARAVSALEALRTAGFADVGIDLIYGLPGQTLASWRSVLRRALAMRPTHVSCYCLTVEAGTPLARSVRQGTITVPDDARIEAQFLEASATLGAAGYVHYEVSNFALGDGHRSRHNGKYWRHVPYLGLGPAAHSFDGRRRWWNVRSIEAYLRRDAAGRAPTAATEHLDATQLRLEDLALGFRTAEGVELDLLGRGPAVQATLQRQILDGRVEVRSGRAVPTVRGFLVADALARAFA